MSAVTVKVEKQEGYAREGRLRLTVCGTDGKEVASAEFYPPMEIGWLKLPDGTKDSNTDEWYRASASIERVSVRTDTALAIEKLVRACAALCRREDAKLERRYTKRAANQRFTNALLGWEPEKYVHHLAWRKNS